MYSFQYPGVPGADRARGNCGINFDQQISNLRWTKGTHNRSVTLNAARWLLVLPPPVSMMMSCFVYDAPSLVANDRAGEFNTGVAGLVVQRLNSQGGEIRGGLLVVGAETAAADWAGILGLAGFVFVPEHDNLCGGTALCDLQPSLIRQGVQGQLCHGEVFGVVSNEGQLVVNGHGRDHCIHHA